MTVTFQPKEFAIDFEQMESKLHGMFVAYDGHVVDAEGIHLIFTSELSTEEQGTLNTWWDGLGAASLDLTDEEKDLAQQKHQREWGQIYVRKVIDQIGAKNLTLARLGEPVNVANILTSLQGIKELLNTGALKTALGAMISLRPSFPSYAPIFDQAISDVTNFLVDNGYMAPPA